MSASNGDGERPTLSPDVLALLEQHLRREEGAAASEDAVLMNGQGPAASAADSFDDDHNNRKFALKEYWNERFETEESYDWLLTLLDIEENLLPLLPPARSACKILMVGCGNSSLSRDLYELGYTSITNIDFSEVVIKKMSDKHRVTHPGMQWVVADMTDMALQFPCCGLFDVIVDKASMDALVVVEEDVWNPQQEVVESVHRYLQECSRLLSTREGSKMIQITFHQPHFRSKYLSGARHLQRGGADTSAHSGFSEVYSWTLSHSTIASNVFDYFLFVMSR